MKLPLRHPPTRRHLRLAPPRVQRLTLATVGVAAASALVLWASPMERLSAQSAATGTVVPVDVAAAAQVMLAETEDFTARLEAAERVELRARVPGPVERVHAADGQAVARGALLFTIDPRGYEAERQRAAAALESARAQAELARLELARAQMLLAQQAGSRQEVEQLQASATASAAAVGQAEAALRAAQLNLEHTQVRAPVAGRLSRIEVTRGNLVDDQRVLAMLVAGSPVHAWFDVSEDTFLRLRRTPDVRRAVAMGLSDEPGLPRSGRVDVIDNRLNPQTGTIRVRAVFDNADGALLPGLYARLRIESTAARPMVMTPDRAVTTDQDRKLVWVVGGDGLPQPRPVELGPLVDGMRVLRKGVQPGELVVVGGLQRVRPGQPVDPQRLATDDRGRPLPAAAASGAQPGGRP